MSSATPILLYQTVLRSPSGDAVDTPEYFLSSTGAQRFMDRVIRAKRPPGHTYEVTLVEAMFYNSEYLVDGKHVRLARVF